MIGKSYIITSTRFQGEIELVYNENNSICAFELRTELSSEQLTRFFRNFPVTESNIEIYKKVTDTNVFEVPEDLTFEKFWSEWCGKQANKERSKALWDKMSRKNKARCMWSLKPYKRYIERNGHWYNPMYPDSYLSAKNPAYLNDYNKM